MMNELLQMTPYSGRQKRMPDAGAAAPPQAGPPNYRPAELGGESCGGCQHFNQGQCAVHASPVDGSMVCDDVTPAE